VRQRLRFLSVVFAIVSIVAIPAPQRAAGAELHGAVAASARNAKSQESVEVKAPKRGGNRFVRVLTAPFRALARLFGGGRKQAGVEAKRNERKAERAASTQQAANQGADAGEPERAPQRAQEERKAGVAEERAVAGRAEAKSLSPTQPQTQAPNVIRPDEERMLPLAAPPGTWVPSIEGIARDHLSQGRALLRHGYLGEAIAELSVAATIGPNLIEANNLLGLAYDKRGWHKQAIEAYERALALAPEDPQVLNNLGYSLYLDHQFNDALKRLKQAARYAPSAPAVLGNLGVVQARLGRYDDAFKSFARAGGEYDARLRIAQLLESAGRDREAVRHYEAALRLRPDSAAVLEHLARLYDRTGRTKDAEAARRTLGNPPNKQRTATGGGGG
jgi:Flp pilus assembly protein TadD